MGNQDCCTIAFKNKEKRKRAKESKAVEEMANNSREGIGGSAAKMAISCLVDLQSWENNWDTMLKGLEKRWLAIKASLCLLNWIKINYSFEVAVENKFSKLYKTYKNEWGLKLKVSKIFKFVVIYI